jgi:hypothetical protein
VIEMRIEARIKMVDEISEQEKSDLSALKQEDKQKFIDLYKAHLEKLMKEEVNSDRIEVEVVIIE